MFKMDRMPGELVPNLFDHSEFDDWLNCGIHSVNVGEQMISDLVDQTKIKELVVSTDSSPDLKKSWFFTKAIIEIGSNPIHPSSFACSKFNLVNLKRLCLNFKDEFKLKMAVLNHNQTAGHLATSAQDTLRWASIAGRSYSS